MRRSELFTITRKQVNLFNFMYKNSYYLNKRSQRNHSRQNRNGSFRRPRRFSEYDPTMFIAALKNTSDLKSEDELSSDMSSPFRGKSAINSGRDVISKFCVTETSPAEGLENDYQPTHVFEDFNIDKRLNTNVINKGYKTPTPIQDQAIEPILLGRDVVGIANTGTGKTAAFLVPLIDKVIKNPKEKVLIVAPTRELAVQIEAEAREFSKGMGINSVLCIGGVGMRPQIQGLYRMHNFVIGTPGRLIDLERQRNLNFGNYSSIVLDEVDCMLDMGFIHDVRFIVSKLPKTRHSLFFSATIPDSVKKVMTEFVPHPLIITVLNKPAAINVNQDVMRLNGRDKTEVLNELLMDREFEKVLVFGRTKHGMEKLAKELRLKGVRVEAIHGNKSQGQRQRAIEMFKQSRIQVLVATDLASRGLDINNVTHVINYDLPENLENYIHRIGRTGRADKKGRALTFIA